jgi:hypothetical protein
LLNTTEKEVKVTKLFEFIKTNNLHIQINIHDFNPPLHVSAADSHHQQAAATLKTQ